jgi:hypothetical protein
VNIAPQAIELGQDDRAFELASLRHRGGQHRAIVISARLFLDERLAGNLVAVIGTKGAR